MDLTCNICGSQSFDSYGAVPRVNARCSVCKSLERHRALHYLLKSNGLLAARQGVYRCLQLAPERVTHDYLLRAYGAGYVAADLFPQRYEHAECLKLRLPDDFEIFPSGYFSLIVHNHVLEHIPGSFRSHIDEFYRLLRVGAIMAFTVPDVAQGILNTVEGGELLPTNEDRVRLHGQEDHFKTFGTDLIDYLKLKFAVVQTAFSIDDPLRRTIFEKHNASGVVYWCVK
jgi:hypothetical protein